MANFEQKTIRDPLLGMVSDHLGKGYITCAITHQVGCELVGLLAAYREEERRLYPEVYLLGNSTDDLLNIIAPGSPRLRLGHVPIGKEAATTSRLATTTSLKTCAPLAIDGWAVYICREQDAFAYGLFRPAAEPYSASTEETLTISGVPAALFRNSASNTVEIINSVGGRLEISLTTASPSSLSLSGQITDFSRVACADIAVESREQVAGYLTRVLAEALRASHGALLAVVPAGEIQLPVEFSDGIILSEPIPLAQATLNAIQDQSGRAVSLLRSYESLLRGMIMSDGITLLGTSGSIRAFRMFVRQATEKTIDRPGRSAGGARSRAFDLLRQYVGSQLCAALFRSQDGRTEVVVQP